MATNLRPSSQELPQVSPYLAVSDGAAALEYYKKAFGATELYRLADHEGRIVHAEFKLGNYVIMLAGESKDWGNLSPKTLGGTTVRIALEVADVDAVWKSALDAGGKGIFPPEDQFYGERSARIEDPFGHQWLVSTHIEDVSPQEMQRRMQEMMNKK
jgi:PhnB protein